MKKLFALTMAAALVMTTASVAFAAPPKTNAFAGFTNSYYRESNSIVRDDQSGNPLIGYGKTAFIALSTAGSSSADIVSADDVKGMKVKATWNQNGDKVESVSIVKKEHMNNRSNPAYFIAVKFKELDSTAKNDVYGKFEVTRSGATFGGQVKGSFDVFFTLGYGTANATGNNSTTEVYLTDEDLIHTFKKNPASPSEFEETEDFTVNFFGDEAKLVVNTEGQGKVILSNTVDISKRTVLENKYPDANFVYINGNGKSFNMIGELTIRAAAGSFLYRVGADGETLTQVKATYDDVEEAFVLRTRTLGTYIVADEELDLTVAPTTAPVAPEAPKPAVNPGTGAVA